MSENRRSFIKKFGITLGSLIASGALPGCGPKKEGGLPGTKSRVGKPNGSAPRAGAAQWKQLRQCWLNLNNREDIQNSLNKDFVSALEHNRDPFTAARDVLAKEHLAILDALVASAQLKKPVAKYMQIAFDEAAYHVVRSMATCYYALPMEYAPRDDLLRQAGVLREISDDLDPATVAKAQAAIAQDIAFLAMFKGGPGSDSSLTPDDKGDKFRASPEVLEAARLLTELFMGEAN